LGAGHVAAGDLRHYAAAILSMPLSLDAEYFRHLIDFAEAGGALIAEACPGRWDKYGWTTLTQLVDGGEELFGAKHRQLTMIKEPGATARWMPQERRFGEFDPPTLLRGCREYSHFDLRANFYLQRLQPTTGEAILTAGDDVVGVLNHAGEGWAVLLGSFLGFSALAYREFDAGTDGFLAALLARAGVRGERCGKLLRRRRVWHNREAWFFINPMARAVEESVDKAGFSDVIDLLEENLLEESDDAVRIRVEAADLACLLLSS